MFRLEVTACGVMPSVAWIATYSAVSASAIIVGPDTVSPGRRSSGVTGRRIVALLRPASTMLNWLRGKAAAMKPAISSFVGACSRFTFPVVQARPAPVDHLEGLRRLQAALQP